MMSIRSTLAALLLAGGAAVASAQQPATAQAAPRHAARARAAGRPGAKLQQQLFRGITLSDAEKANIKSVREKYATQTRALRAQYKPQHDAIRAARQRGDTAALRDLMAKSAAERDQTKQLLQAERADLRAGLTPANQAKFDANAATLEKRLAKRAGGFKKKGFTGRG